MQASQRFSVSLSRNNAVAKPAERGVHAASPCEGLRILDVNRAQHSVRMLKRRERRAPPACAQQTLAFWFSGTASLPLRERVGVRGNAIHYLLLASDCAKSSLWDFSVWDLFGIWSLGFGIYCGRAHDSSLIIKVNNRVNGFAGAHLFDRLVNIG